MRSSPPARTLLDTRDSGLALRLIDAGLVRYETNQELAALRRRALDQLRERYQQLNPFKFILYSRWAGAELPPSRADRRRSGAWFVQLGRKEATQECPRLHLVTLRFLTLRRGAPFGYSQRVASLERIWR